MWDPIGSLADRFRNIITKALDYLSKQKIQNIKNDRDNVAVATVVIVASAAAAAVATVVMVVVASAPAAAVAAAWQLKRLAQRGN